MFYLAFNIVLLYASYLFGKKQKFVLSKKKLLIIFIIIYCDKITNWKPYVLWLT